MTPTQLAEAQHLSNQLWALIMHVDQVSNGAYKKAEKTVPLFWDFIDQEEYIKKITARRDELQKQFDAL